MKMYGRVAGKHYTPEQVVAWVQKISPSMTALDQFAYLVSAYRMRQADRKRILEILGIEDPNG